MSGGVEDCEKYQNSCIKWDDTTAKIKSIQLGFSCTWVAAEYIYTLEKRIEALEIKLGEK